MSADPDVRTPAHAVLRPCFATPPWLEEKTRLQQSAASYYGLGFLKAKLDTEVHRRLLRHLEENVDRFRPEYRIDELGNADPHVIPAVYCEDRALNQWLSDELRSRHEQWCGMRLEGTFVYGIRVYQRGTYLYDHVDITESHVISSTICVDHRLDSPWPLHIQDIDGNAHQIDLDPGDLVFYEGARLAHGRPYPLEGDYYAGIFVHYRPVSPR